MTPRKMSAAARAAVLIAVFATLTVVVGCGKQEVPSGPPNSTPPPPAYNQSGARMQPPPPSMPQAAPR